MFYVSRLNAAALLTFIVPLGCGLVRHFPDGAKMVPLTRILSLGSTLLSVAT